MEGREVVEGAKRDEGSAICCTQGRYLIGNEKTDIVENDTREEKGSAISQLIGEMLGW